MNPETLSALRAALQCAVDTSGLRCVARSAEINVQSLSNFLTCATRPLPGTVEKLRRWHYRQQAGAGLSGRPDELTVHSALDAISGQLQGERRERARRRLLAVLREEWRAAGVAVPAWAEEVASATGDAVRTDGEHPRRQHRMAGVTFTDGAGRATQPHG